MTYKSWLTKTLITISLIILSIGSFNYLMDPMWMFDTDHEYNDVQDVFNERHQKANRIYYQPFAAKTLLVGSSRSTYINQNEFKGMDAYNFSVANISVQEYDSFIKFAKQYSQTEIETIILGLDFFKSSYYESNIKSSIYTYVDTLNKRKRWNNLISWDITKYSYGNFKASIKNEPAFIRTYDRHNVATTPRLSPEEAQEELEGKIKKFKLTFYGKYRYSAQYKSILANVKKNNPDTQIIVFTTPVSEPLFQALVESNAFPHYEKWLREVVEVYGEVYHFMDINTVTKDTSNYFDGHHFYPEVGTLIAHRISGTEDPNLPDDFGKVITSENIDQYLVDLKREVEKWGNE
jgi:hypothetical protein